MTSFMNIIVNVRANSALAKMEAVRASQARVTSGMVAANKIDPFGRRHLTGLMKFGNQLQWTGRMIQYNFTLPILLAGAAATKFYMDQEKAMTHVAKVYGDTAAAAKQFREENSKLTQEMAEQKASKIFTAELEALGDAFTALSNHYGVQKKEVMEIAGAWAAAGASGLRLAKSTEATMKAMIIGDMESKKATEALIAIQAQYNLSSGELMKTLATLNSVENQTGIGMAGLIDGFARAAGVARDAGVDVEHLAAMLAALVPATGSASQAGNALKTVMSRLLAPTREARQVMEEMGLQTTALSWNSSTATERLKIMAEEFNQLPKAQKAVASSVIASRWQINKFSILMREITDDTGYYAKALDAAADKGDNFKRMQKELNTVLQSDPRRLQRMLVMLQNASTEIIQPLIPYIIYLADQLARLARAFANLEPETQKLILFGLVFLALVGPVIRYMGALHTLVGVFGFALHAVAAGLITFVKGLAVVLVPFKMLGTVAVGAVGALSSIMVAFASGVASIFTGALWRVLAYTTRFWKIQIGIWKVGATLLMMNWKLLYLSFIRFWVAMSVAGVSRWGAMWVAIKTITVVGLLGQIKLLATFRTWWLKIWLVTATVTTNIWGRMAVALLLLSKSFFRTLGALFMRIIPILFGPWGIAIGLVVGILWTFRKDIEKIWNNVVTYFNNSGVSLVSIFDGMSNAILEAFYKLPQGVQDAMVAVVTVISDAAKAVYEWFQYLNPFARHSPSLVENVTNGMTQIRAQFRSLRTVKGDLAAVYAEVKKFGQLTANLGLNADKMQQKEDRKTLKKAGATEALASYDKLVGMLNKLNPQLAQVEAHMNAQERVVDRWQAALDRANNKLDKQQEKLDKLQDKLDKYQAKLAEAEDRLNYYASAPLKGMQAMEDQIFANQMAQVRLRYEMMQMEDVVGTFEDLEAKMEAINGLQEIFRGTQADLRAAGAGSEILSQYDAEIQMLEQEKSVYTETANKMSEMQSQLEALQREAEKLDLVKAMNFDELQYEIDKAANTMEELSFDEIMAGIQLAQADVAKYTAKVEEATAAVAEQQQKVDEATAARDRVQERLDKEQATLDRITDRYNAIKDAIDAINSAINDVVASAEKMVDKLDKAKAKDKAKAAEEYVSPGLQNFRDAAGGDFPDPGGKGMPPRKDWSSQVAGIEKFTENLGMDTAKLFENINPFTGLKEKAREAWNWIQEKAGKVASAISDFFSSAFAGVGGDGAGDAFAKIKSKLEGAAEFITDILKTISKWVGRLWDLIGPDVKKIGQGIWNGLKKIWEKVGPELEKFKDLIEPIGNAFKIAWKILKPVLGLIMIGIGLVAEILLSVVGETIGPLLSKIGDVIAGIIRAVHGAIQIILGLITGDFGTVWEGIKNLFGGLWDAIAGIFTGAVEAIWNIIKGLVFGIRDFFVWLGDVLVGHSIVPDIVDGVRAAFETLADLAVWIWNNVLEPIYNFFVDLWEDYVGPALALWWDGVKASWDALKKAGQWVWDNVLEPVWDFFKALWTDHVKGFLESWWDKIKLAWEAIKKVAGWVWDNVLEPVWSKFKSLWHDHVKGFLESWWDKIVLAWNTLLSIGNWVWQNVLQPVWETFQAVWRDHIKPFLDTWWNKLTSAWSALTGLGGWFTTNVLDPIKDAFVTGWTSIKTWFENHSDFLTEPVNTVINAVIFAVNTLIKGLNKIGDILPGVDWHIELIPELAEGGTVPKRRVGSGFKTNGARAIVGEGKANYPEFVIPTDPTHRTRARGLLAMAAEKLGAGRAMTTMKNASAVDKHGVPMFGMGGWLSDRWDDVKNLGGKLADLPKNAISSLMNPLLDAGQKLVNKAGWTPAEIPPTYVIEKVRGWVNDTESQMQKQIDKLMPAGGDVLVSDPAVPLGLASWNGGIFTNRFIAHMQKAEKLAGSGVGVMQGGWRPATSYSGTSHQKDAVDFQVNNALITAFRRVGIAAGDRTGLGNWSPHTHAIPGPSAGLAGGSAIWQWQDYVARGGMNQPLNSPWGLKYGAIVRKRTGGVNVKIGEGRHDEAVVPLPNGWRSGLGETHIHINGDLSFPNITDPADADLFIQNLENMARD